MVPGQYVGHGASFSLVAEDEHGVNDQADQGQVKADLDQGADQFPGRAGSTTAMLADLRIGQQAAGWPELDDDQQPDDIGNHHGQGHLDREKFVHIEIHGLRAADAQPVVNLSNDEQDCCAGGEECQAGRLSRRRSGVEERFYPCLISIRRPVAIGVSEVDGILPG